MSDEAFWHMYAYLCGECSGAIELLNHGRIAEARQKLADALLRTEDMYIENDTNEG